MVKYLSRCFLSLDCLTVNNVFGELGLSVYLTNRKKKNLLNLSGNLVKIFAISSDFYFISDGVVVNSQVSEAFEIFVRLYQVSCQCSFFFPKLNMLNKLTPGKRERTGGLMNR